MTKNRSVALAIALLLCTGPAAAQVPDESKSRATASDSDDDLVSIDFQGGDLQDFIKAMAPILKKRFVYDERVRGEVTVISEDPIPASKAYQVLESVLETKGFAIVQGPSGELKIIPSRDVPQQPVPFVQSGKSPGKGLNFVTQQIRLKYVKVDTVQDTLRQLASKDARIIGDQRTNSLIVTDVAANIGRMMSIVEAIDVATFEEQIKVIQLQYANADELTGQLREVFGSQASKDKSSFRAQTAAAFAAARAAANGGVVDNGDLSGGMIGASGEPRFIPDGRTNSVIVIAAQAQIDQVERTVTLLDYKREGRGKIRIYKLKNANAEDVAETLAALASGQAKSSSSRSTPSSTSGALSANRRRGGNGGGGLGGGTGNAFSSGLGGTSTGGNSGSAEDVTTAVTELEGGVKVTADAATNSLIIQATPEAYASLADVIQELDARRPQVMLEAAILEVNVRNNDSMGGNLVYNTLFGGANGTATSIASNPSGLDGGGTNGLLTAAGAAGALTSNSAVPLFTSTIARRFIDVSDGNGGTRQVPLIAGIIAAARSDGDTNIISTPKILTADNEEAQIVVGETRGFPTSSLSALSPNGGGTGIIGGGSSNDFQTQTNIERQDVGVTMRVTPQISEGDSVRMKIFTEVSNVTDPNNRFGPTTSNRTIENTVYVKDGEAVMIGGIIQDSLDARVNKVPVLGDIPLLGWAFRNETKGVVKTNLIMVLTPRIVRDPADLTALTTEGREKFRSATKDAESSKDEDEKRRKAQAAGIDVPNDPNPVRRELGVLEKRYPTEKLPELRDEKQIREDERQQKLEQTSRAPGGNYLVQVALLEDPSEAAALLEKLLKQGYDGVVLSRQEMGKTFHYVQLGPYPSEAEAQKVGRQVKAETGIPAYVMIEP